MRTTELSERECEVMSLINLGLTNVEVARKMGLKVASIRSHLANIYTKLDADNRTEAALKYRERYANQDSLDLIRRDLNRNIADIMEVRQIQNNLTLKINRIDTEQIELCERFRQLKGLSRD